MSSSYERIDFDWHLISRFIRDLKHSLSISRHKQPLCQMLTPFYKKNENGDRIRAVRQVLGRFDLCLQGQYSNLKHSLSSSHHEKIVLPNIRHTSSITETGVGIRSHKTEHKCI